MSATSPDVKSIFGRALEIESPAERSAYLGEACAAHPELRAEVEDLLRAMVGAGDFMKRPAPAGSVTISHAPIAEGPGTRIGPYRLLQQIGEGGMGVVYMAEQEQPVRRKVALKIIKPGMDSAQVVARFEAERQALAVMDHTNIARVFDAGTTASGRPYFVMELVHGVPITKFCDDNQLTPRERLELFVPVCQAIQHAHQKGIIHRDIKPSNVLVTMYDDRPVPKVIDFGVAKAVEQRLTERTLFTQFGAMVGTFEYMSPEQAEMNAFGVDTRSDIYSLGVLLYELLTGTTPLEKHRLRQAALGEMVRLIKEEEPPRPSVRLSSSGDLPSIAAARKTEPARLSRLVRGEVDWIVMKCLEKDRTRRYETAIGLARDVDRYLHDEPVEACPPSAGYRLRKFARKYRTPLAVAAGFLVLLVADVIFSTWQAARARRAEERATAAAVRATEAERRARQERDEATDARKEADVRREESEASRQSLRRSLYASDMQLAEEAWESGNVARMLDLLNGQRPAAGQADLRGFEWHYLRRLGAFVQTAAIGSMGAGGLSPDGTRLVQGSSPRVVDIAEMDKGYELKLIDINTRRSRTIVVDLPSGPRYSSNQRPFFFSPDGRRFGLHLHVDHRDPAGQRSWLVKVYDWETGREIGSWTGPPGFPAARALDRSAESLALGLDRLGGTGGCDLKVWDVEGRKELYTIPIPDRSFSGHQALAFSPDRTQFAGLTSPDGRPGNGPSAGEVRIWEARSGKEVLRFATGPGGVGLTYSLDGKQLAVAGTGGASHRLYDARSGRESLELAGTSYQCVEPMIAFSPDGSRLASVSGSGRLYVWELTDLVRAGARPPEFSAGGNNQQLEQPGWDAGGRFVTAYTPHAPGGAAVVTWRIPSRAERIVVSGPSKAIAVAGAAVGASRFAAVFRVPRDKLEVKVWDETGKIVFGASEDLSRENTYEPKVRLSPDGTRLALVAWIGQARGSVVDFTGSWLRVWDLATGRELYRRTSAEHRLFWPPALSPDGRLLALATLVHAPDSTRKPPAGQLALLDLATGRERWKLDLPGGSGMGSISGLAFSPDGRRLTSLHFRERALRIWDATTGRAIVTRSQADVGLADPVYSPDGRRLAIYTYDGSRPGAMGTRIQIIDASSGGLLGALASQRSNIRKLIFSPDGRRLASSAIISRLVEIKLWDLAGGAELLTLHGKTRGSGADDSLAFSPDGYRLYYLPEGRGRDAEMQVWDATPMPDEPAAGPPQLP